ncbi:MmgE/PrpD family protein [Paraburkholderia sp. BL17N1]|uniref:MmgE/PrpD family protein n=1 Tax=Paraburkholderia sp. BL17N1 TaxID=1938798 RepID=UPI000EB22D68|nr:MmgE/PrpD family protein [Paraburkholderia sp. BL17N1]RKR31613.1 MmgE/PrpD family protein [Paraburkholderia sp. BL17N1]
MHEPTQHSAVSDALSAFAVGPLGANASAAVEAARARVAQARTHLHDGNAVTSQLAALLLSQGSSADDLRVRAWTLGATLASAAMKPDVPVLATAVVVGEATGASEADMVQATAIGIEAAARLLAAVDSAEFRARWNVASATGLLGAVLVAARLYGLDATRTRHAMGVAATQAAGLAHNVQSAIGALETGKAAADAIEAALIAKHGFTSAPASIDGRRGLAALMAYRFDAVSIVDGIGTCWVSVS